MGNPTADATLVIAPAEELVERLRGSRGVRPAIDPGLAGGVRAWLEDGIFERFGAGGLPPMRLTSRDVAPGGAGAGTPALLRGAMVAHLVALRVGGAAYGSPLDAASEAMAASGLEGPLLEQVRTLDADELARLRGEVAAHDQVLRGAIGELPGRWSPRCGVRLAVPLCGGRVVCSGRVDLVLGSRGGTHAGTCLVDVTTAPLDVRHETLCRYLALLETLRTGEQPLRVAVLSTAEGSCLVEDVDAGMLADAVTDVLEALDARAAA